MALLAEHLLKPLPVDKQIDTGPFLKAVFLWSICDGEWDESHPNLMPVNATKAYGMALKKYHSWIVQKIFQAALYAAPYKSDFLKALSKGQNVMEEECLEKVRLLLVNYTATIDVI
ncbi:Glycolipid transfer protein [Myotis brandtii]|uniref:Glycolipid transfer protein n=1 Tax=Myotis brandtii TaxID=109478 RepID=S7N6P4_MYOBR|nr:Glycolipid transfer protein [Myotis brandtii]